MQSRNLYPVVKSVLRPDTGHEHRQRYWIASKDILKDVHAGHPERAVSALGGNWDQAQHWLTEWSLSPQHTEAIEWSAAATGRSLSLGKEVNLHRSRADSPILESLNNERVSSTRESRRTAEAMAIVSQEAHGGPGGTTKLFRGLGRVPSEVIGQLANGEDVHMGTAAMSSWSESESDARMFMAASSMTVGISLEATFLNTSIAASCRAFKALEGETEVVVTSNGSMTLAPNSQDEAREGFSSPPRITRVKVFACRSRSDRTLYFIDTPDTHLSAQFYDGDEDIDLNETVIRVDNPSFGSDRPNGFFWRDGKLCLRYDG